MGIIIFNNNELWELLFLITTSCTNLTNYIYVSMYKK